LFRENIGPKIVLAPRLIFHWADLYMYSCLEIRPIDTQKCGGVKTVNGTPSLPF